MTEHLNDLLTVHHFLNVALGTAQRLLLAYKIFGGAAADPAHHKHHTHHAQHHHGGQPDAVIQHDAEHRYHRYGGDQQLRKALADHLAQRVDIVGIIAHDIAMIVGIEIADGKVLHAVEHLLAHFFQRALRDDGHELSIYNTRCQAEDIKHRQQRHQSQNAAGYGGPIAALPALLHGGNDVLHEDGRHRTDDGVEQDARHGNGQQHRIKTEQRADETAQHALGRAALCGSFIRHRRHLPCSERYTPRGRFCLFS